MAANENWNSFFNENKQLAKNYLETRLDIYRLIFIRTFSKSAGYFIWIIISLFLLFLVIIFMGIVTGFWLSELTGSYTNGFGLATLIVVFTIFMLAMLRKTLFVNPIIRSIIRTFNEETNLKNKEEPI